LEVKISFILSFPEREGYSEAAGLEILRISDDLSEAKGSLN